MKVQFGRCDGHTDRTGLVRVCKRDRVPWTYTGGYYPHGRIYPGHRGGIPHAEDPRIPSEAHQSMRGGRGE